MEMICYCNKVTIDDMQESYNKGNTTLEAIIEDTGAMKNSNCALNNPKGTCCYNDLNEAFIKIQK